ncbi:class I adenylate-forming enzyme family protein [Jannaschia sp. W003]|uniref:class I adenylate-forming enzyme family protein n=1 Tax=Jannaschia sp. W003 TaxID=2867012 RepID=UPI0021A636C2|nr:class I adenylate-forming enzyme family protein [Jannaschia sp. W003]UWQ21185.1 acyl--CoA ligase [Jannaschia sp. W003]
MTERDPARFNLAAYVLDAGRARPDHPALEVLGGGPRLSHGALLRAVERRAGALAALGLPGGARVLLRLGNSPDFPVTHLACAAAGLVPVPTSALLTEAEIGPMAKRIAPALAVHEPGIALPPGVRAVEAADLDGPALPFADWPRGDAERLGYLVFTSGSGGAPKAVAHAHRAVLARRAMWEGWYGLRASDRMLHAGAFNWTYTLGTGLLDPWAIGATALIPAPDTAAEALPTLMAEHGATIFAAAPGVYRRLLRGAIPPLPALRHGLSAGEALPPATRAAWREATGTDVHEALGMSECSTFVSGSPARPAPEGWSGHVQPGRVARVRDGHLEVGRGDPGLMLGYWEDGAPRAPEGEWFPTGDLVEEAGDGAIRHLGRADAMLNPGGYRVSPVEVEAALAGLPVEDVAVGEVRTDGGATVLAAYYVGPPLDQAAADAHAAARLARYKQPRMWLRRERLPRNPNGKLIRAELR